MAGQKMRTWAMLYSDGGALTTTRARSRKAAEQFFRFHTPVFLFLAWRDAGFGIAEVPEE